MYIMCPNGWSKVYHLAEPDKGCPGKYRVWCEQIGFTCVGTKLEHYAGWHGLESPTLAPIAVEGIPTGRRLCKMCERLRLTSGSTVTGRAARIVGNQSFAGPPGR